MMHQGKLKAGKITPDEGVSSLLLRQKSNEFNFFFAPMDVSVYCDLYFWTNIWNNFPLKKIQEALGDERI